MTALALKLYHYDILNAAHWAVTQLPTTPMPEGPAGKIAPKGHAPDMACLSGSIKSPRPKFYCQRILQNEHDFKVADPGCGSNSPTSGTLSL